MEFTQGVRFDTFGLSEATMRAIRNKHYEISTPVQAGCIPPMLAGKDVIAKAPTGTGKTMAFGIPIIERIDPEEYAMDADVINAAIEKAVEESKALGIHGKETTPFLLAKIKDITGGDSLASNIQLVYNNARLAARTAKALCEMT